MSSAEDATRLQYQQLVNEYGAALAVKDPRAEELLVRATLAWEQLRRFGGAESALPTDAHLVTALQFAIEAGDAREAGRIYASMSKPFQDMLREGAQNAALMAWISSCEETPSSS